VHCYSLVHDDLPAMDNDDLRRGRPTAHKAFDEATAILAGDSLLTYAFDLLSRPDTHPSSDVRIKLVMALARASGLGGMVGGQILDLAAEGRFPDAPKPQTLADVETLQAMKTGALIRFGAVAGAILGEASPDQMQALERYGAAVGQAFQIADDLLDIEGDAATVGKQTGKDAAAGKATIVGVLGIAKSKERLKALVDEASSALSVFGAQADVLKMAATFVAERQT
jgi:farnesyl diphosphate synthase